MNSSSTIKVFVLTFCLLVLAQSCTQSGSKKDNIVRIWEIDDPDGLNPFTSKFASATNIKAVIYQRLLRFDLKTLELVPELAVARPDIETIGDSAMRMTFEIRPEARWDNGESITAKDVEFSFKAVMCPHVDDLHLKPYINFVSSFEFYEDNPRKISIVCDQIYMRAEASAGYEVWIIPAYNFDPENLLAKYTYDQLRDDPSITEDPNILKFAEQFNSEQYSREKGYVIGSGPYRFESWETGARITLVKKQDWWGNELAGTGNPYFEAYPDKIIHEIINDQTAAVTALKAGTIDVLRAIKPKDFEDLRANENASKSINLSEIPQFAYSFLGINTKNPILSNPKTRQAIACLVDYNRLMNDLLYGHASRISGAISPLKSNSYNDTLPLYQYDLEKAKSLLSEAGWGDADKDGYLDKIIDGKKTDFEISFIYNTGNTARETVILVIKESAEKVGIKINVQNFDANIYSDKLVKHDFDMFYGVWQTDPAPDDNGQLFMTSSANDGDNYTYFGNAESDALIEEINRTIDESHRAHLEKKLQEIMFHDCHYIFLWAPKNLIGINKRFENTNVTSVRPGYWAPGFKLVENNVE